MMAPLVLAFSAFIWDLRGYIAHRTDLAREVRVIAEVVSAAADNPLVRSGDPNDLRLVDAFIERFARSGAGSLDIAVVTRGTNRPDGTACPAPDGTAATWCPPTVTRRWPAASALEDGLWQDARQRLAVGGDCAPSASALPAEGDDFGDAVPMLRNEAAAGTLENWISRRLLDDEWWVVVDVCLHPGPGVFTGPLIRAGFETFDFGSFTPRIRAVWRAVNDTTTCTWCNFPLPPP